MPLPVLGNMRHAPFQNIARGRFLKSFPQDILISPLPAERPVNA